MEHHNDLPRVRTDPLHQTRYLRPLVALTFVLLVCQVTFLEHLWPAGMRLADAVLLCFYAVRFLPQLRLQAGRAGLRDPVIRTEHWTLVLLAAATCWNLLVQLAAQGLRLGPQPWAARAPAVLGVAFHPALVGSIAKLLVLYSCLRLWRHISGPLHGAWAAQLHAARTVLISFAVTIGLGWVLLTLPETQAADRSITPLDALFTSTSATCVTGLIVKDTPHDFSTLGHVIILLLMQAGGLGIMTLSSGLSLAIRGRSSLQSRLMVKNTLGADIAVHFGAFVKGVVLFTILSEILGTTSLGAYWLTRGVPLGRALWHGAFHSVSAFCNAGFALFSNSFEGYTGSWWLNAVVGGLIVIGGLGFPVVYDLYVWGRARRRRQRRQLSLHTRLVLLTSGLLLLLGAIGVLAFEQNHTLKGLTTQEQLLGACFQSVTTRTAGFNTLPIGGISAGTVLLFVGLMCIGASPGSTGGGFKTSTFAVLILVIRAMIRGTDQVSIFRRTLPEAVRHRAVAVAALLMAGVFLITLLLCLTEDATLAETAFETASAWGTVGLSMGLTSRLTQIGKVLIILAMYAGRVGPLTLALAIRPASKRAILRYPAGEALIG